MGQPPFQESKFGSDEVRWAKRAGPGIRCDVVGCSVSWTRFAKHLPLYQHLHLPPEVKNFLYLAGVSLDKRTSSRHILLPFTMRRTQTDCGYGGPAASFAVHAVSRSANFFPIEEGSAASLLLGSLPMSSKR
jgi:hypothetical protein